ncbi:MAG: fused MFS/spermidine synthase [Clostridiales bacterium]|nr:fused MFS/spermidine synthase [Clostridiales bacterium]
MNSRFLYLLVFITGASIMELEMSASRLLAPYFGTSQLVWANLIGLILIGLSAGYWLGGKLADRYPRLEVLLGIVLFAGAYQALIPLFARPILKLMIGGWFGTPITVILLSFAAILLIFLPPTVALATASPYAIRLATRSVQTAGEVAGNLYAASTFGSIVGTFLPAFVTIPFLGTRWTLILFAGLQMAIALYGLRRGRLLTALLAVPLLGVLGAAGAEKPVPGLRFEGESFYQYVQVVEEKGTYYLVINEGGGIQSLYRPGAFFTDFYADNFTVLPFLVEARPEKILVIGSAGGTLFRLWDRLVGPVIPLEMEGIEIDPLVASLGPRYFGLRGDEAKVRIGDGRVVLAASGERYDLIVVDAYSNQLYIPFQLTTREFFMEAQAHLRPGGILALNVNAVDDQAPLLEAMKATLASVFPHTYVAKVRGPYNYLLVGAEDPVDLRGLAEEVKAMALSSPSEEMRSYAHELYQVALELEQAFTPYRDGKGLILTDDRAPVEYLTHAMIVKEAFKK